ncbi:MAG: hypothetical protein KAV87_20820 [Desulfobacteraceae bacterium]|nr:hypothetical protein [Desulfobacteraceae bacterium]
MAEYTVLSPIGKDKKRYEPGHPKLGTIELTDKEAQPLLDAKVVCRPGEEPVSSVSDDKIVLVAPGAEEAEKVAEAIKALTSENKELRDKIIIVTDDNVTLVAENKDLTVRIEAFESAAAEEERQSVLAEIPVEDRGKIVGVMKAMIEAKEGCGDDGIPNVKELNTNLKDVTTVKVNAVLRNALMGEI